MGAGADRLVRWCAGWLCDLPGGRGTQPVLPLLDGILRDVAMFAAVLSLGEVVRSRRALDRAHRLLAAEQERSEQLLLNVLPAPIVARLKTGENVIADRFSDVTVLFADLVDFTRSSEQVAPAAVVEVLNELFSAFDELARHHGLEKIKTVGDAYMVAGGLPEPRADHAEAVADLALAMREEVAHHQDASGQPLQLRMGIDTGPVVAGVIGRQKFSYDLWGAKERVNGMFSVRANCGRFALRAAPAPGCCGVVCESHGAACSRGSELPSTSVAKC